MCIHSRKDIVCIQLLCAHILLYLDAVCKTDTVYNTDKVCRIQLKEEFVAPIDMLPPSNWIEGMSRELKAKSVYLEQEKNIEKWRDLV